MKPSSNDPMEKLVRDALVKAGIRFIEGAANPTGMDFYLPDFDIYIEVKQFYAARIARQMSKAENVIAVQGRLAVEMLARMLSHEQSLKGEK